MMMMTGRLVGVAADGLLAGWLAAGGGAGLAHLKDA